MASMRTMHRARTRRMRLVGFRSQRRSSPYSNFFLAVGVGFSGRREGGRYEYSVGGKSEGNF